MKLLNAFSIQMCSHLVDGFNVKFSPISERLVKSMMGKEPAEISAGKVSIESYVGHPDTASVLSGILGIPVAFNRQFVSLEKGETVLVAQYCGTRLPEGATMLPEGAQIRWFLVTIE